MARDTQSAIAKPLPITTPSYDPAAAEVMRRTIEQNFEDVYVAIARLRDQYDRDQFLAACATDFLVMGAQGRKP